MDRNAYDFDYVDCGGDTINTSVVNLRSRTVCARKDSITFTSPYITVGAQGAACSDEPTPTPTETPTKTPTPTQTSTPASTPASTPTSAAAGSFTIKNTSGSGQIDNVTTSGGVYFYFTSSGSFPVSIGQQIDAGGASLTSAPIFVDISSFSSSSCLVLYINSVVDDSITVTGNGTYTFSNKTFTTSDVVLIDYDSSSC
jgi:hypothetical protein